MAHRYSHSDHYSADAVLALTVSGVSCSTLQRHEEGPGFPGLFLLCTKPRADGGHIRIGEEQRQRF